MLHNAELGRGGYRVSATVSGPGSRGGPPVGAITDGDAYALRGQQSAAVAAWKQSAKYGSRVARQRLGDLP